MTVTALRGELPGAIAMMSIVVFGFVLALLLLRPVATVAQPVVSAIQDPVAGSRVFGAKGCARCHAVHGMGGRLGPDLGRIAPARSFSDLAAAMWNHLARLREQMGQVGGARPGLSPQETGDLIAFLFTLGYFDAPGNPEAGKRLFTEKRCIVCHQVASSGGVIGPSLDILKQYGSPVFLAAAMWNHGPVMPEAMPATRVERPALRDSELRDLIAYIKSASSAPMEGPLYILPGRADEGRRLFVVKRCVECHGTGAQGGRVGPRLAERRLHLALSEFAVTMWNKAPAMMAAMKTQGVSVTQLRADEMADLLAYLEAIQYFAPPGDPRRGRELATSKGCFGCHRAGFEEGKLAGDLPGVTGVDSPAVLIPALWNHALVAERLGEGQPKVPWPEFRANEMADLVAFLHRMGVEGGKTPEAARPEVGQWSPR